MLEISSRLSQFINPDRETRIKRRTSHLKKQEAKLLQKLAGQTDFTLGETLKACQVSYRLGFMNQNTQLVSPEKLEEISKLIEADYDYRSQMTESINNLNMSSMPLLVVLVTAPYKVIPMPQFQELVASANKLGKNNGSFYYSLT